MSHRVRSLFFATLAVVLGPLALPERASDSRLAVAPVLETAPVQHEAHPATYGARAWLADRPVDRATDAPLRAARAEEPLSALVLEAATPAQATTFAAAPSVLLPPSRAPPELS